MDKFTKLTSVVAPLLIANIDTDMIIPKQYLKTLKRSGLGQFLFDEMRRNHNGGEVSDFVLNKPEFKQAKILIAGENFGCGSSREHAPWALLDYGIRCIIAPSFADIFYNNCFKNGILPLILNGEKYDKLLSICTKKPTNVTVDLEDKTILFDLDVLSFDIEDSKREILLHGLDDIGMTLKHEDKIQSYEVADKKLRFWNYE